MAHTHVRKPNHKIDKADTNPLHWLFLINAYISLKACWMYDKVFWSMGTELIEPELLDMSPDRELAWKDCSEPGDDIIVVMSLVIIIIRIGDIF